MPPITEVQVARRNSSDRRVARIAAAKRRRLNKRKRRLTPAQKRAIQKMKTRGVFRAISKRRESLALPATVTGLLEHSQDFITFILREGQQATDTTDAATAREFVRAFLARDPAYSQTDTGMCALQLETWLAEHKPAIFARLVETEVQASKPDFFATFTGLLEKDEIVEMVKGAKEFVEMKPVVRSGDRSANGQQVSDLTIFSCVPIREQKKSVKLDADYKAAAEEGLSDAAFRASYGPDAPRPLSDALVEYTDAQGVVWGCINDVWRPQLVEKTTQFNRESETFRVMGGNKANGNKELQKCYDYEDAVEFAGKYAKKYDTVWIEDEDGNEQHDWDVYESVKESEGHTAKTYDEHRKAAEYHQAAAIHAQNRSATLPIKHPKRATLRREAWAASRRKGLPTDESLVQWSGESKKKALSEGNPFLGRKWASKEGERSVPGTAKDGRYIVMTRGQREPKLLTAKELEQLMAKDRSTNEVVDSLSPLYERISVGDAVPAPVQKKQDEPLKATYKQWLTQGNSSTPVPDTTVENTIAASAYNVGFDPMTGKPVFTRLKPKTDELYRFESSETESVLNEVDKFWSLKPDFQKLGLMHARGMLLYGPPGSGKSSVLQQVVETMVKNGDLVIFVRDLQAMLSGIKALREVESDRRVVVVMEDVDEIARYNEHALLQAMDGDNRTDNVLYIGTTNYIDRLPPRMLRPGRFDKKILIPPPATEAREKYLRMKLKGTVNEKEVKSLAKETEGMSFGHLRELIAGVYAFKEPVKEVLARLRETGAERRDQMAKYGVNEVLIEGHDGADYAPYREWINTRDEHLTRKGRSLDETLGDEDVDLYPLFYADIHSAEGLTEAIEKIKEEDGSEWCVPNDKALEQEYKVEYLNHVRPRFGDIFPTLQDFKDAVNGGERRTITPGMDRTISNRSRTQNKDELLSLISGYRSFPQYRNETTLDNLYQRVKRGQTLDCPLILRIKNSLRVMSGNTRMDIAFQAGKNPTAIIIEPREKTVNPTTEDTYDSQWARPSKPHMRADIPAWKMTQKQYVDRAVEAAAKGGQIATGAQVKFLKNSHRAIVLNAYVRYSRPVPANVLKDYPDLQKKTESRESNALPYNDFVRKYEAAHRRMMKVEPHSDRRDEAAEEMAKLVEENPGHYAQLEASDTQSIGEGVKWWKSMENFKRAHKRQPRTHRRVKNRKNWPHA